MFNMRASTVALILALLAAPLNASNQTNIFGPASAVTTRYWDCCKPSCSWTVKADYVSPVLSCDINSQPLHDASQGSSCNGGKAFECPNNSPWAVNDTFSYGFVGAFLMGGDESTWCGACYHFKFTSGAIKGKEMIVQATNTDYDSTDANTFTFGIPGGNTSYAGACATQFGVSNATFGADKVGVSSRADCDNLPKALQAGCQWRFDWFEDTLGPTVDYTRISCPEELTNITGGLRKDDTTFQGASSTNSTGSKSAAPAVSSPSIAISAVLSLIALVLVA